MNLIYYPKQDFYNLMQNPAFREEKMNRFLMNIERFANGEIAFEEGAILLDGKISFFFAYVKYEGEEKSQIGKYGYLIQGTRFNVTAQRKNVLFLNLSKCQNSSIEKHVFLRAV